MIHINKEAIMRDIIFKDLTDETLDDVVKGFIQAFPHWKYDDAKEIVLEQQNDNEMEYIAAYTGGRYAGLAVIADIFMNLHGHSIKAIDLDHLHIDLLVKKKGISSELIKKSCAHALDMGIPFMFVGPFSTKFYHDKGFGFGIRKMMFESAPEDFRNYGLLDSIKYYNGDDKNKLCEFISKMYLSTKGNITFKNSSLEDYYEKLSNKERVTVIHKKDGVINGYLTYKNSNNIVVDGIMYDSPEALHAFSTFLHSQKGQANNIRIEYSDIPTMMICDRPKNITNEEYSMVKILDVEKFFTLMKEQGVNFNNQTLNLEVVAHDKLTDQTCDTVICFKDGLVQNINDTKPDVKISLDIADFSSLVIGRYSFYDLINCGLVKIDNIDYIDRINKIFNTNYIPLIRK